MLMDVQNDVQISGGAAIRAGLAFALHAQARAGVHTGGNAQFDGSFLFDATLTAALRAAFLDDLSRALAGGAGTRNREKSLLIREPAPSAAGLAGCGTGSRFPPRAIARASQFLSREFLLALSTA